MPTATRTAFATGPGLILEGDIEPVREYRVGCYDRSLLPGDLLWLLKAIESRADTADLCRLRRQEQGYAVLSASDPMPGIGVGLQAFHFLPQRSSREVALNRGL